MTTTENATESVELQIGGMTCAACANRVEKKLNKLDGVTASVNYVTRRPRSPARWFNAQALIAEVEKTGYSAALPALPGGLRHRPRGRGRIRRGRRAAPLRQRLIGATGSKWFR